MSRDTKIMIVVVFFVSIAVLIVLHRQITITQENSRLFRDNLTLKASHEEEKAWADYWKEKATFYRAKYDSAWAVKQFKLN